MTVREDNALPPEPTHPLSSLENHLTQLLYLDGERVAYIVIFVLAVLTRFWDLGARVMSHDESLHTRYSWALFRGEGFAHTPLMHGPVLFHMVALSYLLFGDNDFTARLYPTLLGIIIVMIPFFLRKWLGRLGAISASTLFLISPMILYYSRYIREDIPAITGALIMVVALWRYVEGREFKYLIWLSFGQFLLFASKEVSFFYVAIFGSYLMLFFITRLFEVRWESQGWYSIFAFALIATLITLTALGIVFTARGDIPALIDGTQSVVDPSGDSRGWLSTLGKGLIGILVVSLIMFSVAVLKGQWRNLRRFPELDAMIVMGSLILPTLTPLLMHSIKTAATSLSSAISSPPPFLTTLTTLNPMDTAGPGVTITAIFTAVLFVVAISIGVAWGLKPPGPRKEAVPEDEALEGGDVTVEVSADKWDWVQAVLTSRWWIVGGLYWLLFIFFFTTMFTNGNGLGTGVIGSLAYWLEQQDVQRGGQPWYYYIQVMLPIYEFLPVILALAAGTIGIGRLLRLVFVRDNQAPDDTEETTDSLPVPIEEDETVTITGRKPLDLDTPVAFPVFGFTGYWAFTLLIALSVAGEKMPWITTHLTTPLILLGGWVVGRLLERIEWRKLLVTSAWVLFALVPLFVIALARVTAPLCTRVPTFLLCNTLIPTSYQAGILTDQTAASWAATGVWIAALVVVGAALGGLIVFSFRIGLAQMLRVASLCLVIWLAFQTARAAWGAAYINYDDATEFLVYAHSSGAVKDVLAQIEEISLKTTDGYGLRVAYDDKVSWPYSWYFRNYYNAIFYGSQPSRGLIGDAPVILAGPENWTKVESLLGDRYYHFEYIRMWWPMQDYFELRTNPAYLRDFFGNAGLQRGVWEIFYKRSYSAYAQATGKVFDLNQWPLADRMRVYIRKDTFAQVWDYGVAASQVAESIDPYVQNVRQMVPDLIFGQGQLNRPHQIAIGPDGLLYVADSNNHRIAIFDQEGQLVRTLGKQSSASTPELDTFNEPWGLGLALDGTLYVADTWNSRIAMYTSEGEAAKTWGYYGPSILTDPMAFWAPRAVAIDAQGQVYVADTGNKRVQVFDQSGEFLRQIGAEGTMDGQLDEPVGLGIGSDGLVYVADTWNRRVQVFTSDGLYMRQWPVEAWFTQTNERPYIALDDQDNIYITDPEAFRVIVFNNQGSFLYSFGDFSTIGLAGGIAVDGERLFLSDTAAGTIQRYVLTPP